MSQHQAHIVWKRQPSEKFVDLRFSRAHTWRFDGGVTVPGSSAPTAVPLPYSKPENVDPEEAFVASLSSCHMLTFIWLAAKAKFIVDSYDDVAVGSMSSNAKGRMAVTSVRLEPKIVFSGEKLPSDTDVAKLHHGAHEQCFIANSVLTEIAIGGSWSARAA
jgi:organic hydroperoxide reductase OsmC/OhrA